MTSEHESGVPPRAGRKAVAGTMAVVGTIIWTHALAGVFRGMTGNSENVELGAMWLTMFAAIASVASIAVYHRRWSAAVVSGAIGLIAAGAIGLSQMTMLIPAMAVVPVSITFALGGSWMSYRLPVSLDASALRRPKLALLWSVVAVVALIQVGRLSTYMTDPESDWFLSTRHGFYYKHECATAYVYAAELAQRGDANVYHAEHYPGLRPSAEPQTQMSGLAVEDPYQYAPQFLLWPRLAIELTHDYHVIRVVWFAINVSLCMGVVLMLSLWMGGRIGTISALCSPFVLLSFPVLYNFQYGQFHFAAVALAVLGLLAVHRDKHALGGGLLAIMNC